MIREAVIDDWEQISDYMLELQNMHAEAYPEIFKYGVRRNRDYFIKTLANQKKKIFVSEEQKIIQGYVKGKIIYTEDCEVKFSRRYGYMDSVYVAEKFRGRLIEQKLFARLFQWFRENGIPEAEGAVWEFNKKARKVFELMGSETYQRKQIIKL